MTTDDESRKRAPKTTEYQRIGDTVSIYKRDRMWYANYQLNGKQMRRSLGTAIKHEAIARANSLERDLATGKSPLKAVKMAAVQVRDEYFTHLDSLGRTRETINHYRPVLRRLLTFMDAQDARWIGQIDLPLADAFRRSLQTLKLKPRTVSDYMVIVHSFVLFACRRRYLESDPLLGMPTSNTPPTAQPFWTWPTVLQILAAAPPEYRPLFAFLAYTGARIGEAVNLEWSDVDFANGIIHIRVKEDWRPKSGVARAVPMCMELRVIIEGLTRKSRWVLTRPESSRMTSNFQIVAKSALVALRAVLKPLQQTGRLHTFRHSFISHALTQGTPEAVVRTWVGHVDPAILRLYTHVASPISKAQMEDLFNSKPLKQGIVNAG